MVNTSRGTRAVRWGVVPGVGAERGQARTAVGDTAANRAPNYDSPTGNEAVQVTGPLAAYLALLHVCGPEALEREFVPEIDADIFSVWNAQLAPISRPCSSAKAVASFCPELGTRYPAAA